MSLKELYIKLKDAYTDENLNKITAKIIDLYKSKQYYEIKNIAKIISEFIDIKDNKVSRCFSKLIMIYHPDKGNFYRTKIDEVYKRGNLEELTNYSHILTLQNKQY